MLGAVAADFRHAWRALRRAPAFFATAVVTLSLAIGAVAGMFNVVYTVLLRPLPFAEPDRLVLLGGTAPGSDLPERFGLGFDFYFQYKEQSKLIDGIFIFSQGTSTFRTADRVERVAMTFPSNSVYSTLGASPQRGRLPTAEDGDRVVVISDRLWQTWFGRDESVIGKKYFVSGADREVIGIMPPDFRFPTDDNLLWVAGDPRVEQVQPGNLGLPIVARMKPGVTRDQLAAELTQISKGLPARFGGPAGYAKFAEQHRALVDPLLDRIVGPAVSTSLWVILGAVAVVLLIACANVANLFLVRAEGRRREMAVRRAIGAGRAQLARLHLAEALVVALVSGILAIVLSIITMPLFVAAAPQGIPRLSTVTLDLPTLAAAFALVIVVALLCGIAPALRASTSRFEGLREGGRGNTGRRRWTRDALVAIQTALALALLIGSVLLVRSFQKLHAVDAGYDTADLYTFQFAPEQPQRLTDGPAWGRFHLDFMDRLRALPGVTSVGIVNNLPLDEGTGGGRWLTDSMPADSTGTLLDQNWTAGDYFRAMGIEVLRGRIFTTDEAFTPNTNILLSRSAADRLWPGQEAVGKVVRRRLGNQVLSFNVVGVVADVKQDDWRQAGEAVVYFPLTGPTAQIWAMGSPAYVVKSSRAADLTQEVRDLVRQVAPEAPVYREFTMQFLAQRSMVQLSFTMLTLGVISTLALLLGAIGLYGVLSVVVAERTREIGVRMALGATAGSVRRMVATRGVVVVAIGIAIGLGVAAASTGALRPLLFGIEAGDPTVFATMPAALLGIGLLAAYLPARRASRVDPTEALRRD
jgi:putative ABC transport system permease protein